MKMVFFEYSEAQHTEERVLNSFSEYHFKCTLYLLFEDTNFPLNYNNTKESCDFVDDFHFICFNGEDTV